jgi:calcineurin-like phosphoesterase
MTKPKLLWIGDIIARTGFARVTENVLERIKEEYEVVVSGCNWHGDHILFRIRTKSFRLPIGFSRLRLERTVFVK